jgi:hypothetical protein
MSTDTPDLPGFMVDLLREELQRWVARHAEKHREAEAAGDSVRATYNYAAERTLGEVLGMLDAQIDYAAGSRVR